jgi:hypothetical protein
LFLASLVTIPVLADKKFIETSPEREGGGAYEGSREGREKEEGDGLVDGFLGTWK